jgi:hypothetical protein
MANSDANVRVMVDIHIVGSGVDWVHARTFFMPISGGGINSQVIEPPTTGQLFPFLFLLCLIFLLEKIVV